MSLRVCRDTHPESCSWSPKSWNRPASCRGGCEVPVRAPRASTGRDPPWSRERWTWCAIAGEKWGDSNIYINPTTITRTLCTVELGRVGLAFLSSHAFVFLGHFLVRKPYPGLNGTPIADHKEAHMSDSDSHTGGVPPAFFRTRDISNNHKRAVHTTPTNDFSIQPTLLLMAHLTIPIALLTFSQGPSLSHVR